MKAQSSKIRTGVIGVGSMGQNHARVYDEISNLIAIADPDEEQARKVAERFDIDWYSNYRDMLEHVDAVTISVPTFLHLDIAKVVAGAGVHMLVEKPLANNAHDAQEIVDLAQQTVKENKNG